MSPSIAVGAFQKIVAPGVVYCATTPCGAAWAVIIGLDDAEGVGVGAADEVGVEVAEGVGRAFAPASVFRLCALDQTTRLSKIIPTTTAKTTRPEAPVFLGRIGAVGGRG